MRVLVVLAAALSLAAAITPRVQMFDAAQDLVSNRAQAMQLCISRGHCIAHDSQIAADLEDGYTGHHKCGFTWDSHDGKPRHAHCKEHDPHNHDHCKAGQSTLRNDQCPKQEKFGVYCRVSRTGENLPHPCKIEDSDLTEVYRIPGPFENVPQAVAGCSQHGGELAYYSQVAAHVDRYDIQFCQYNILRVDRAVYRVNCNHSGEMEWNIIRSGVGYGALCRGIRPHPFENPCKRQFPTIAGKEVYCDQGGWIIVQDRPPCSQERNHFSGRTWSEYRNGFGSLDPKDQNFGGYWLGLQPLYTICSEHNCRIRFQMSDPNDNYFFAEYDSFKLGPENAGVFDEFGRTTHYQLLLGEYAVKSTAPNALQEIQKDGGKADGSFFSLGHRDGDNSASMNCADIFDAGWWYSSCHRGNLNGICTDEAKYLPKLTRSRYWKDVATLDDGLRRTRIKIIVHDDYHGHV